MQTMPQRVSLVAETEKVLREGMLHARWKLQLPGERRLCEELRVSRWTLRSALKGLAHQGFIRIHHGRSCSIIRRTRQGAPPRVGWRIGCISPDSLGMLTSFAGLWFSEMRTLIQKNGGVVDFYCAPRLSRPNCGRALDSLVKHSPHHCWILLLSTPSTQRWFYEHGAPAVVAGSLYDGIQLPSVDIDNHAVGRHAAGAFLARGHVRIGLLAFRPNKGSVAPGVIELERGAREACQAHGRSGSEILPIYYDNGAGNACRAIDRALAAAQPPTAFFCAKSASLLTAMTHLAQRRLVIPRDLSIIVAQDENYFPSIVPEPAHYRWNPTRFAASLYRMLRHAVDGTLRNDASVRLLPGFLPGKSLSAPAVTARSAAS